MKNILIIGGMGPQASVKLHQHILSSAVERGANEAADFPAITHLSLPFEDFIAEPGKKDAALDLIRRRLYYLWRHRF